jgi:hypothetical protein
MLDVEQTAEARPQGGRELGPPVRCDGGGNSEPGPAGEEGPGALGGGDGREGMASGHLDVWSIIVKGKYGCGRAAAGRPGQRGYEGQLSLLAG